MTPRTGIDRVHQRAAHATIARSCGVAVLVLVLVACTGDTEPGAPSTLAVDRAARAATVKLISVACGATVEGSGFVVMPGLVATNAHVVAGASETVVEDSLGDRHEGAVVGLDPRRDLAVVSVPDLAGEALALGEPLVGSEVAIYGFPHGGSLRAEPAQIDERIVAIGTDIYDEDEVRRDVIVLVADLDEGDSGAPIVDARGVAVGIAFAVDPDGDSTAYALTSDEITAILGAASERAISTGSCVGG